MQEKVKGEKRRKVVKKLQKSRKTAAEKRGDTGKLQEVKVDHQGKKLLEKKK